jgi:hypothetical protein
MNPVVPLKKIYINKTLMETGKMLIDFKIILEMRTDRIKSIFLQKLIQLK